MNRDRLGESEKERERERETRKDIDERNWEKIKIKKSDKRDNLMRDERKKVRRNVIKK